jgi:ATP-dependent DNA helicase RecG
MIHDALATPVINIKGIGPKIAENLSKKGIQTVLDLFYFLPIKYIDRRHISNIGEIEERQRVNLIARVVRYRSLFYRHARKKGFEAIVDDGTGQISLKWFQWFPQYLKNVCRKGNILFLSGEVTRFGVTLQMVHPDITILDEEPDAGEHAKVVPIYSEVEGIKQGALRKIMAQVVTEYGEHIDSVIPAGIEAAEDLDTLRSSFSSLHLPDDYLEGGRTRNHFLERIIMEEYVTFQSALLMRKREIGSEKGIQFSSYGIYCSKFLKDLGFELTAAQQRVVSEIDGDMASDKPMNRLLQGDVGSGKTVCAVIATLRAVDSGYQAAFMAPTEILAEQHYLTIHKALEKMNIPVVLLRGNLGRERSSLLKKIAEGAITVIVGTHAVIQQDVAFRNLGLAIIDEQHRFGVLQRKLLKDKGLTPDVLMMTATPIPRTLSMVVYGDLDVSLIDEMPKGRQKIRTKVHTEKTRDAAYRMVEEEVREGRQAYIVYPLVEGSEKMELLNATEMADHLQKAVFPSFKVGLLHGRMKAEEKEEVMSRFKDKAIDVLVCTTVIEVGIDVPNATMIVIEHAERFGLSQLHQLRGRVGRGVHPSQCILIAGEKRTGIAVKRLKIMEETTDGFKIAEEDMNIRGVGDMLGVRQSGIPKFRAGDIIRDMDIMLRARKVAGMVLDQVKEEDMARLKSIITGRWNDELNFSDVA